MNVKLDISTHPEYQNVTQWLKESSLFDFDLYLENKGKSFEEFEQMLAKDITDFVNWFASVTLKD
jgi:hypothetical protein